MAGFFSNTLAVVAPDSLSFFPSAPILISRALSSLFRHWRAPVRHCINGTGAENMPSTAHQLTPDRAAVVGSVVALQLQRGNRSAALKIINEACDEAARSEPPALRTAQPIAILTDISEDCESIVSALEARGIYIIRQLLDRTRGYVEGIKDIGPTSSARLESAISSIGLVWPVVEWHDNAAGLVFQESPELALRLQQIGILTARDFCRLQNDLLGFGFLPNEASQARAIFNTWIAAEKVSREAVKQIAKDSTRKMITLRMPITVKREIDRAARLAGKSTNSYCIARVLR